MILKEHYRAICEIGASHGEHSVLLSEIPGVQLTVIDPCIDSDLVTRLASRRNVEVHRGLSLDEIPKLRGSFDCILLDGDHNWYTLYNELTVIDKLGLLRPGGTILLHDVGWPYGRRDMYYAPERIPRDFIHPHGKLGIVRGVSQLSKKDGMNAVVDNALHEGGARNGVATAVEDFCDGHRSRYIFLATHEQSGLGVLRHGAKASDRVKMIVLGFRLRYQFLKSRLQIHPLRALGIVFVLVALGIVAMTRVCWRRTLSD